MEADATTVAVVATVIARDDVSEADVYNFLFGIFENTEALAAAHSKALSWIWSLPLPTPLFPIIPVLRPTSLRRASKFPPSKSNPC